jgi:hypothetical protein
LAITLINNASIRIAARKRIMVGEQGISIIHARYKPSIAATPPTSRPMSILVVHLPAKRADMMTE